jgi:hypothetical protein
MSDDEDKEDIQGIDPLLKGPQELQDLEHLVPKRHEKRANETIITSKPIHKGYRVLVCK